MVFMDRDCNKTYIIKIIVDSQDSCNITSVYSLEYMSAVEKKTFIKLNLPPKIQGGV